MPESARSGDYVAWKCRTKNLSGGGKSRTIAEEFHRRDSGTAHCNNRSCAISRRESVNTSRLPFQCPKPSWSLQTSEVRRRSLGRLGIHKGVLHFLLPGAEGFEKMA